MNVAIIGPGAMGCLFAGKLGQTGANIHLIDHNPDRAKRIAATGIRIDNDENSTVYQGDVSIHFPDNLDLILVCTKAHTTQHLTFPQEIPVLSLQNGLGNIEALCSQVGSALVLAGTTAEASTLLGEGHIRHVAPGKTYIGAWTSANPQPAIKLLKQAGFDVHHTDSPGQRIWEKVAVNACINPLTALLDVPNGELLDSIEIRNLLHDLVVEATKVATAEGYRFEHSLVEHAESVCRSTSKNISSMLQDIRNQKKTEIDAISGEIIRRAEQAAIPTPRTRVIYQLIRGLEER